MPITFLQMRVTNAPVPYPSRIFHIKFNDPYFNLVSNTDKIYSEVCISSIHHEIIHTLNLLNLNVQITPSYNDIDDNEYRNNFHPLFFDLIDLLRKIPGVYGYRIYNCNYIDIISGGVHGVGDETYFVNILEKFFNSPRNAYEYMKNHITYENSNTVNDYKRHDSYFMLTNKNLTKPFKQLIVNIGAEREFHIFDNRNYLSRRGKLFLRYLSILFNEIVFEHTIEKIILSGCNVIVIFDEHYEDIQIESSLLKQILEYTVVNNKNYSLFKQSILNHPRNQIFINTRDNILRINREMISEITNTSRLFLNNIRTSTDDIQSLNRINRVNQIEDRSTQPTNSNQLFPDMIQLYTDIARRNQNFRGRNRYHYTIDTISQNDITNRGINRNFIHHEVPLEYNIDSLSLDEIQYSFRPLRRQRDQIQNNNDVNERRRNTTK